MPNGTPRRPEARQVDALVLVHTHPLQVRFELEFRTMREADKTALRRGHYLRGLASSNGRRLDSISVDKTDFAERYEENGLKSGRFKEQKQTNVKIGK